MARVLGIVLPDEKRIDYALTLIYGIGWTMSKKVLKQTSIDPNKKVKAVTEEEIKKIVGVIDNVYKVEGDLREEINENVKRLRETGTYRGMRHSRGLPAHGQRTRSNARTKRGKRKTVGALKKEAWAAMEGNKSAAPAEPAKK